eukprot:Clim_evm3s105 gene=Clim_evmTU3s105
MTQIFAFVSMAVLSLANIAAAGPVTGPGVAAPAVAAPAVVDDSTCPSQADCQNWCPGSGNWCPGSGVGRYCSEVQPGYNDNCPSTCEGDCWLCFGGWDETAAVIDAPAVAAPAVAAPAVVDDSTCPSQADCQNWCPESGVGRYCSEVQPGYNDNCPSTCGGDCWLCFGGWDATVAAV